MAAWSRMVYAFVIGALCLANVNLALARYGEVRGPENDGTKHAAESMWWKNYHWHKATIRSHVKSSNSEALKAVNVWNEKTVLTLPSATTHTDISVLRGAYGLTRWRGLAELEAVARDSHCANGYCEIKHCHATLNTTYSGSSWRYQGTYCMEIGHCLGLAHDSDIGCMNSSAMNAGQSNAPSADNIKAINGKYAPLMF